MRGQLVIGVCGVRAAKCFVNLKETSANVIQFI